MGSILQWEGGGEWCFRVEGLDEEGAARVLKDSAEGLVVGKTRVFGCRERVRGGG